MSQLSLLKVAVGGAELEELELDMGNAGFTVAVGGDELEELEFALLCTPGKLDKDFARSMAIPEPEIAMRNLFAK